ncbi:MAG: hypothetical protein NXH86_16830 [Flavobacteriaceae bacterium]|jgi:hypothetical protein|uniref:hypothetical protein n=1 Tax=Flagellimonas TaxID=444459 RepID=UPI000E379B28|nr:hypothetical protein [Allomuricauda sp.]MCR9265820.1 hypothetical protein [Flavobacteriaceae bacterium]
MKYALSLLMLIGLLSCKAQSLYGEKMEDLVLVAHDGYSGISEYETMVIQDTKSLNKFYAQINKTRKPGLPVPSIDFSTETVLVVCLGELQGEKEPMLSRIQQTEDELLVAIELSNPAKEEGFQAVSHPFYLYKMPRTPKEIHFQKVGW